MSSLDLSPGAEDGDGRPKVRRLNKLPVFLFIGLVVIFFGVIIWGLSIRGLNRSGGTIDTSTGAPATDFADQLKRGVSDGVIEAPRPAQPIQVVQPVQETEQEPQSTNPFQRQPTIPQQQMATPVESEADWRERLKREQDEQMYRLLHQQRMARLQADDAAYDSPIAVNIGNVGQAARVGAPQATTGQGAIGDRAGMADLYAAALRAGGAGQQADPNNQAGKTDFFNQDITDLGYLPNRVVPQQSPFELKRGSVIPATLVTGINSDLPGRITAQVSQNVYDSATGHRLLVPQGAKLFGRYDSNVSFGQSRVLVIWTDLIFPNGSTLQIGGMAGVDAQGYGGFRDQVDCAVVLATQSISDAEKSGIIDVLKESCPTKICLPNGAARESGTREFYERIGFNERQIEIVATALPKREYYVASPDGRRLFDMALGPITLSFVGASGKDDIKRIDELRVHHGDEWPVHWLKQRGIENAEAFLA